VAEAVLLMAQTTERLGEASRSMAWSRFPPEPWRDRVPDGCRTQFGRERQEGDRVGQTCSPDRRSSYLLV
jgi:hypothetical protein